MRNQHKRGHFGEILMDCGNLIVGSLNCSLIGFLKLKYFGTFTHYAPYFNPTENFDQIKDIFSYNPSIIVEIQNRKFVDI